MVESEFGVKAAQLYALAAELAAAVSADTSGPLAVEVLPEVFGAGRQLGLLTCRLIERADRSGAFRVDGAASTVAFVRQLSGESDPHLTHQVRLFPHRSPRQSSANAAVGGLESPPAGRLQRAYLHLPHSTESRSSTYIEHPSSSGTHAHRHRRPVPGTV